MSQPEPPLIHAVDVSKVYPRGREEVHALRGVSFSIARGDWTAIVGPSGSGKTTLLNLLGCMDTPTSGSLSLQGTELRGLAEAQRTRLRSEKIGFVFQHFGLVPTLSVSENVSLPTLFDRRLRQQKGERQNVGARVDELLEVVGLSSRRGHRPHELSGGEMQRVAIARALINSPQLLLADEPTGNLDSESGASIIELFRSLHAQGLSIVVVTHNGDLATAAHLRLSLRDGQLLS
jgi:putative ABC transport system ATP-binding protein